MLNKNSITPEYIVNAFKETGLKAIQGDYFDGENCACALGCLFKYEKLGENVDQNDNDNITNILNQYMSDDFRMGVAVGFDGGNSWGLSEDYKEGFEIGKEAWKMVEKEGIVVDQDEDGWFNEEDENEEDE
jgi:hypothetical protein